MTEHPAVAFLRNAHERAEELVRSLSPGWWPSVALETRARAQECTPKRAFLGLVLDDEGAQLMTELFDLVAPERVLARIEAERAILDEHRPYQEIHLGPLCFTCVGLDTYRGGVAIHQFFPCNVAVGLAKAWGWTEEP